MNKKIAVLAGSMIAVAGANSVVNTKSVSESLVDVLWVSHVVASDNVVKNYDLTYEIFNISKEPISAEKINAVNKVLSKIENDYWRNGLNITKSLIKESLIDYETIANRLIKMYNKLWVRSTYNLLSSIKKEYWKEWVEMSVLVIDSSKTKSGDIIKYVSKFVRYINNNKWVYNDELIDYKNKEKSSPLMNIYYNNILFENPNMLLELEQIPLVKLFINFNK